MQDSKISKALWAMTELEAEILAMLEMLERARLAMREALEGGRNST